MVFNYAYMRETVAIVPPSWPEAGKQLPVMLAAVSTNERLKCILAEINLDSEKELMTSKARASWQKTQKSHYLVSIYS